MWPPEARWVFLYRSGARVKLQAILTRLRGGSGAVPITEQSMIQKVIGWGPAVLWAAVLFLLSAWSAPSVSLDSGIDKLVHGGAYLVLGLTLAWGRDRTASGVSVAVLMVMGVVYGALVEWYQTFVPGREAELMDGLANALGVLAGYLLFTRFVPSSRQSDRAPDEGTTASSTVRT